MKRSKRSVMKIKKPAKQEARQGFSSLPKKIRQLRMDLGLRQDRFAEMLEVDQSQVSRWERGQTRPDDSKLEAMARLGQTDLGAFLFGLVSSEVPVVGHVGAGQEVYPIDDHEKGAGLDFVTAPIGTDGESLVCVTVRGTSMFPMKEGWLLFYRRDHDGVAPGCMRQLSICKMAGDGPMLVKEVHRGSKSGLYTLVSWNADPLVDVCLDWAAPVLDIRPTTGLG